MLKAYSELCRPMQHYVLQLITLYNTTLQICRLPLIAIYRTETTVWAEITKAVHVCSPETLLLTQKFTWRHNPKQQHEQEHFIKDERTHGL
jgi:hypothetical protein